jgi:hypothetical protein
LEIVVVAAQIFYRHISKKNSVLPPLPYFNTEASTNGEAAKPLSAF